MADSPVVARLDRLIARGRAMIEARKDPAGAGKNFPNFPEAHRAWRLAGKDLLDRLVGPNAVELWMEGDSRAMNHLHIEPQECIRQQERQIAMLLELREDYAPPPAQDLDLQDRFRAVARKRAMTKEAILDDLRRVAKEMRKNTVTYSDYERRGKWDARHVGRTFHGWNKLLEAAGLDISLRRNIPNEQLFENLARIAETVGRTPMHKDMVKPLSKYSDEAYKYRFGTWKAALEAFELWLKSGELPEEPPRAPKDPGRVSLKLRYQVIVRDSFKCVLCGRSPATHPGLHLVVDHKKPKSLDGPPVLENLRTLCHDCNAGKSDSWPEIPGTVPTKE